MKDVLSVKMSGVTFVEQWISLFQNIHATQLWDAVLGIVCIIVLLFMRVSLNLSQINLFIFANGVITIL